MPKRFGRWIWLAQAVSGAALLILAGLHWLAQHYLASGGLRTYAEAAAYLRQPLAFALETLFLVVVTSHALLGVRAVVLDLNPPPHWQRKMEIALFIIGLLTVAYGLQLTWQIVQ